MASAGTTLHAAPELARLLEFARSRQRKGALQDADNLYSQVLIQDSTCAAAWFLRSTVALAEGETARAAEQLETAIRHSPHTSLYYCNLGEAYRRLGRTEEAIFATRQAITLKHDFADAHRNLGVLLEQHADLQGALQSFETAWKLQPSLPGCAARLVQLLRACGRVGDAITHFHLAERHLPQEVDLAIAGASVLSDVYRFDEAANVLTRHLGSGPPGMLARVHAALGRTLADSGCVQAGLTNVRRAAELVPSNPGYHSMLLHFLTYAPGVSSLDIKTAAIAYGTLWPASAKSSEIPRHVGVERSPRLRVGYVSGALRHGHADVHLVLPWLTHHDRERFSIHLYSNCASQSQLTTTLRGSVDDLVIIHGKTDSAIAKQIRQDQIDVLVDLSGHTTEGRLGVFAQRAAPVQVTWQPHPTTTGLAAVDYHLTTPALGGTEPQTSEFTEAPYALTETALCYAPLADVAVNRLPAITRSWFTFGAFGEAHALSDTSVSLWAEVLRCVTNARLRLLSYGREHEVHLGRAFERCGVAKTRLDFILPTDRDARLREYHRVDCCLDTVPSNGVLSSFDAWWMGVPVVSLSGSLASSRTGRLIATALGATEFAAETRDGYIAAACDAAADLDRLAALRKTLRRRLEQSPLMNGPRLARALEDAYRTMYSEWRSNQT